MMYQIRIYFIFFIEKVYLFSSNMAARLAFSQHIGADPLTRIHQLVFHYSGRRPLAPIRCYGGLEDQSHRHKVALGLTFDKAVISSPGAHLGR